MKKLDSKKFKSIIEYGTRNLEANCAEVNRLNVFPVPDGDTGTNMVLTLKNGLKAISGTSDLLPVLSSKFSGAIVLGARGNSGVIISQFFKGISDVFAQGSQEATLPCFISAFDKGVALAYEAVAHPVEGTVLTVLRDVRDELKKSRENLSDFEEAMALVCNIARSSLERTPELLPILKKAGVVDSGAAGMVYFFEGVLKYLNGEEITADAALDAAYVDYSSYNSKSKFELGFCTEILLQLLEAKERIQYDEFKKTLKTLGGSLVISKEGDKLKIHIHTPFPEKVMLYCHRFGEFLSLKIENMTVQHKQSERKFLRSEQSGECDIFVIAVAYDRLVQQTLSQMGADVVMFSREAPSSADYLEAFELAKKKDIVLFPNSSNAMMSALQAVSMYKDSRVEVLRSDSVAACYSFLAVMDFEQTDLEIIRDSFNSATDELSVVQIARAQRDVAFDGLTVSKGDFFAYYKKEILGTDSSLERLAVQTIRHISSKKDVCVVNLFFGKALSGTQIEAITQNISGAFPELEIAVIPTEDTACHITLSLE